MKTIACAYWRRPYRSVPICWNLPDFVAGKRERKALIMSYMGTKVRLFCFSRWKEGEVFRFLWDGVFLVFLTFLIFLRCVSWGKGGGMMPYGGGVGECSWEEGWERLVFLACQRKGWNVSTMVLCERCFVPRENKHLKIGWHVVDTAGGVWGMKKP